MEMDDLDRKIIRYVCNGTYSYKELAKLCNSSRNTIYRRIAKLEKMDVITRRIMAFPHYDKLNLAAVNFGANVSPGDLDKVVNLLKKQPQVKFLWKTYGTHDLIIVIVCDKGEVGKSIHNLKSALDKLNVSAIQMDSSTSYTWEKIDLSPY